MTKKFTCTSAEELLNKLLSEGCHRRGSENDPDEDTFLEIAHLTAYDGKETDNEPIASAEIIRGMDNGVPYCMCFAKDSYATNNDRIFNSVFDAILKELANYPPRIKSNTR